MKYHKPEVLDIGTRMQRADGQVSPNACVSGAAASNLYETCGVGTGAGWSCVGGGTVTYGYVSCVPGGSAAVAGDCLSGTTVTYYCENGSGGDNEPRGCRVGPSFA